VISEIVRNIAIMALMTVFFEMLLPKGELQRFARVVTGLLLLLAVLNPVLSAFYQEQAFPAITLPKEDGREGILQAGEDLRTDISQDAKKDYQETLAKQIAALAGLAPGVQDVKAEVSLEEDGSLAHVTVNASSVKEAEREVLQKKISQLLTGFYSLNQEQVDIIIIAGKDDGNGGGTLGENGK